jgi:hypothetical protein
LPSAWRPLSVSGSPRPGRWPRPTRSKEGDLRLFETCLLSGQRQRFAQWH